MSKRDALFVLVALLICISVLLAFVLLTEQKSGYAVVEADGSVYAVVPLYEDTSFVVESMNGTNTVVVRDGRVYITDASCPDKICVGMGAAGELSPIVCRPNRVVVYLIDDPKEISGD